MTRNPINIPNLFSSFRILLVPVLVWLARERQETWFLAVLTVALATDALDGYLARKLDQTSDLGAKLDSWGDSLTYGAMVLGLIWLWPDIMERERSFVFVGMSCYLVPTLMGLLKYRELPSFHTWSAKASAVAMVPAYYLMVMADQSLLFRMVVVFDIWVAAEAVLITAMLRRNRNNVASVFHAREIVRQQAARLRGKISSRNNLGPE